MGRSGQLTSQCLRLIDLGTLASDTNTLTLAELADSVVGELLPQITTAQ